MDGGGVGEAWILSEVDTRLDEGFVGADHESFTYVSERAARAWGHRNAA